MDEKQGPSRASGVVSAAPRAAATEAGASTRLCADTPGPALGTACLRRAGSPSACRPGAPAHRAGGHERRGLLGLPQAMPSTSVHAEDMGAFAELCTEEGHSLKGPLGPPGRRAGV